MKSLVYKSAEVLFALCLATAIEQAIPQTSSAIERVGCPPSAYTFDCTELSRSLTIVASPAQPTLIDISSSFVSRATEDSFPPRPKKSIFYPFKYLLLTSPYPLPAQKQESKKFTSIENGELFELSPALAVERQPEIDISPQALQASTSEPDGQAPSIRLIPAGEYQGDPSVSVGVPLAYGLVWRTAGIGLGLQSRTRYTTESDGGLGISIGLGNPQKSVGFDVGVSIFDLSEFASRGALSFKIHRTLPDDWAVAVGIQNAIVWGYTDAGTSVYGAIAKTFRLQESPDKPFSLLVVSGGIGSGQFRSESAIKNDISSVGIFGSVALRVIEPVNAIAEWTGQDLTLGLSYVPFKDTPLVLTGAATDLTGNAGDGARLLFRVGYTFSF